MKLFAVIFFATIILSFFLPFWITAPIALISSWFLAQSKKEAIFLSGLAVALAWLSVSIFKVMQSDNTSLVSKMGALFIGLDDIFGIYFIFSAMVFLAFILGSLAGYSGYQLKKLIN